MGEQLKSNPYFNSGKSREEWAEHIANGHPSPVSYTAVKLQVVDGLMVAVDALPVHLRRSKRDQ